MVYDTRIQWGKDKLGRKPDDINKLYEKEPTTSPTRKRVYDRIRKYIRPRVGIHAFSICCLDIKIS